MVDPAPARRIIDNRNLRTAHGWADVRDLHGAFASTSDTPIPALSALRGFDVRERDVDALLDVGFALLRAFDRDPAVEVTPLDRPKSLRTRLAARRLAVAERGSWMRLRDDAPPIPVNSDVEVRLCGPEDARAFANTIGGNQTWLRRTAYATTVNAMQVAGNNFYLGCMNGEHVSTLHLQVDGPTAGIYAVGTARAHRREGIASTLMARAIADARAANCDLICLGTALDGYAESLYVRQGFERVFESELWITPAS
jgi:ribosomal protein S18 acetylase RimI-like enzyme